MMSRICLFELCKGIILVAKSNWGVSPSGCSSTGQEHTRYLLAAPIFVGHCHQTISSESGMGKNETYTFSDLPYMYNILEIIWRVEIHKRCQFSRIENKMSIAFIIRILSVTKNVVEWKYLPGIPIFSSQTYKLPELDSCCRCSFS